jgi:hypothetical protein
MRLLIAILSFLLKVLTSGRTKPRPIDPIPIATPIRLPERVTRPKWDAFCEELGELESGNRYDIVNSYGYLGRYQFGLARLTDFGLCVRKPGTKGWANTKFQWANGFSQQQFLRNKELQDRVFEAHIHRHKRRIEEKYKHLVGQKIRGVQVTIAGMLACFHLVGEGGFQKLLRGSESSDAFGTNALTYMRIFQKHTVPDDLKDITIFELRRDSRFA